MANITGELAVDFKVTTDEESQSEWLALPTVREGITVGEYP